MSEAEQPEPTQESSNQNSLLVAELTGWAWKRSLLALAFIVGIALWFVYDGAIGWPKKDAKIDAALSVREEIEPQFAAGELDAESFYTRWNESIRENRLKEDDALKKANQRRASLDGELKSGEITEEQSQQQWAEFLDQNPLSNESVNAQVREGLEDARKGEKKYREQFYYAAGCGVIALAYGVILLRRRGQKLTLDDEGLQLPKGTKIPFEKMQRVDRRKWHQGKAGLAYLFYEDAEGKTQRATLDGLKYGGFEAEEGATPVPEQIMNRILEHEHIELLDLASEVEGEGESKGEESTETPEESIGENNENSADEKNSSN